MSFSGSEQWAAVAGDCQNYVVELEKNLTGCADLKSLFLGSS